jgi:hypothetical protein
MPRVLDPFRFVLIAEPGFTRATGRRRMRFNVGQRRRLAAKAKELGRKLLAEVATIVTPRDLIGLASEADRR